MHDLNGDRQLRGQGFQGHVIQENGLPLPQHHGWQQQLIAQQQAKEAVGKLGVLQSTVQLPTQATPPEDLATLLQCHQEQVVDVVALVAEVSGPQQKTTPYGERLMVEVTIMGDSGTSGAASSKFTA